MAVKHDLQDWVQQALKRIGGRGTLTDVAKEIWRAHESDLRSSGDLFFTWQYDMLSAVTAAVVGVVLNLSVWFTLHTVFGKVSDQLHGPLHLQVPQWATFDWMAAALAAAALVAMLRFKLGMGWTLLGSAAIGALSLLLKS